MDCCDAAKNITLLKFYRYAIIRAMAHNERSLREFNMAKRRQRILHEARRLITRGGFEALNLRALASAAEVTVPTIYNLLGNKEALVVALFSEALTEIEQRVGSYRGATPLEMATAVVTESTGVYAEDEQYYRAAFIALEHLDQSGVHHETVAQVYRWGKRIITDGFNACAAAGLLRGRIPATLLGEQILRSYRTSCRAWAFGQISTDEFRAAALADIYTSLAADAVETFHATLIKKIAALGHAASSNPAKRVQRGEGVKP